MHKIALVLAIAAVGEGLIALHLVQQLQAERENTQTLQARVTALEHRGPQPGATFVAVPTQPTSPFTVASQSAPAQSRPAGGTPVTAANAFFASNARLPDQQNMREQMAASIERQRTLMQDPEYREAMRTQQKMMLRRTDPDLAKDLHLTDEQRDRLFDTLADQSLRSMDTQNMWVEQPDPAKLQEIQRKVMEQQSANEAELKTVLGEAKYREWQEYQAMAPVRWEATRLRTTLANAGVPLEPNLAKPLMKVLQEQQKLQVQRLEQYAATPDAQVAFVATAGSGDDVIRSVTNSVESLAQSQQQQREALGRLLTPEQLKVIEDEQEAELQMQRVQMQLMRAQQEAGGLDPAQNATATGFFVPNATVAPTSD